MGVGERREIMEYFIARGIKHNASKKDGGGSVVTPLIVSAMNHSIIDKAFLVHCPVSKPRRKMCSSVEDVLNCRGSKYMFCLFDDVGLDKRTVVTGLSCQFSDEDVPYYKIGLFTGLCPSVRAYEYLYEIMGIEEKDIRLHVFRKLIDGKMMNIIKMKDGRKIRYPTAWWTKIAYTNKAEELTPFGVSCMICKDNTNSNSDISVGDVKRGWSMVIVRTKKGKRLMDCATLRGYVEAKPIEYGDFLRMKGSSRAFRQKEILGGFGEGCKEFNEEEFKEYILRWV